MVKVTASDLAIIAGLGGAVDFWSEGKFSAPVARALKKFLGRAAPVAARGAAAFVPRALGTVGFVAMKHPWVATAAVIYVGIKNREKIRSLLEQGYDIVEPAVEPAISGVLDITEPGREELLAGIGARPITTKLTRRPSSFNKAVKAGMAAVKKSTSYGKKGTISPAKKAFSVVVKLASAKLKKKKAPKSGIRRRIWHAMRL